MIFARFYEKLGMYVEERERNFLSIMMAGSLLLLLFKVVIVFSFYTVWDCCAVSLFFFNET